MDAKTRFLNVEDVIALERIDSIFTNAVDVSPGGEELAVVVTRGYAEQSHTAIPFLIGMDLGRLQLVDLASGGARTVLAPNGQGLSTPLYSPDGRHLAVVVANADGLTVGVVDVESLSLSLYTRRQLLIDFQRQPPFQWIDADTLICQLLPDGEIPSCLHATRHVRDNAPAAWNLAMGNDISTASALRIDKENVDGGDSVLFAVRHNELHLLAVQDVHLTAVRAFEKRPKADRIHQDALADYHAAERILWQGKDLTVESWRNNQGSELRVREKDLPPRCLLKFNTHLHDVRTGEVRDVSYLLADARPGSVRCILPPDYEPGQCRPAVMFVYPRLQRTLSSAAHHWVQGPDLVYNAHLFAAQGYVVLEPNLPFDASLDGELIDALSKAVIPALDAVEGAGLIDRSQVQVFGQSAGGWAVMALLATTNEFRSGISMAGICDVASFETQPDVRFRYQPVQPNPHCIRIGASMLGIDELPWQAPQRYLHNSPLYRVQDIQAPLLLMHGDLDYVHISQSEAMFMALNTEGKSVEFVRYWGEDHIYCSAANIRDAFERIVGWLDRRGLELKT
jgi:dipeptidyl aminopeptidase/acylaminoacyl peptidase